MSEGSPFFKSFFDTGKRGAIFVAGAVVTAVIGAVVVVVVDRGARPSPVEVAVETDVDRISVAPRIGAEYWFAVPIARLPRPPSRRDTCVGRFRWARAHGGLDATTTMARMTVSKRVSEPLTISGFRVDVIDRQRPRTGSVASCAGGGGGPRDVHILSLDLDQERVVLQRVGSSKPEPTFSFTLSGDESLVFDLVAQTFKCDCQWVGKLELVVGGKSKVVTIDDHGHPFETMAVPARAKARYEHGRWRTGMP